MYIYELKPTVRPSTHWESSYYKGRAIVRAADVNEARMIVTTAFDKAVVRQDKYRDSPESPWRNSALVSCIQLEDSEYETQGSAELLFPEAID